MAKQQQERGGKRQVFSAEFKLETVRRTRERRGDRHESEPDRP
jgi:hypothetical protein